MRILASNAIYYLLVVISQLATLTQGAFFRVGKPSKAATEASEGASGSISSGGRAVGFPDQHSYWYPASSNEINEEVAKQQLRIFSPSPTSSSSSKPSWLKKLVSRPKEKEQFSALNEDAQRRQAFAKELLMFNAPADYHINMIQLCFKNLLEKSHLNEEEALKWLEVLKNTLHEQRDKPYSEYKAISALYGLYSLRLRYLNEHNLLRLVAAMDSPENPEFLGSIDGMIAQLIETYFGVRGEGGNNLALEAAWEKELLNPSQGLSDKLANKDSFISITKDDKELSSAMHDNIRYNIPALTKLQQNFNSYSAHKRVAILAVLYHQMAASAKEWEEPIKVLENLRNSEDLFPHERKLLAWISDRSIRRRRTEHLEFTGEGKVIRRRALRMGLT